MSTQRRVQPLQRLECTERAGTGMPSSIDHGHTDHLQRFRRVAEGLTVSPFHSGTQAMATNSLSSGSSWTWRFRPHAGLLPEQLPSISPFLSGGFQPRQERRGFARAPKVFAETNAEQQQSASPQVLTGVCPRTERQYGQGNLYLQHAARNAAGYFGRRSARRDLLRA